MATAGSIVVDLLMRTGAFETDTARAERRLKSLEKRIDGAAKVAAAAAAAGFAALTVAVRNSINYMDEMGDAAERTSVGARVFSELAYAANMASLSQGELERVLRRSTEAINHGIAGGTKQAEALKELGISAYDASGNVKTADQMLRSLADRFSKMEPSARKTGLVIDLFGQQLGQKVIPLLNLGADGLNQMAIEAENFGLVVDEDAARAAGEFNDNLDRLIGSSKGLAMSLTAELIPALNQTSQSLLAARNSSFWGWLFSSGSDQEDPQKAIADIDKTLERVRRTRETHVQFQKDNPLFAWSVAGDIKDIDMQISHLEARRSYLDQLIRQGTPPTLPTVTVLGGGGGDPPPPKPTQATELQNLIKQLQIQHATLGMTTDQAERYRIEIAKGSEADRRRALALHDQITAWEKADKAIKAAAESSRYLSAIGRELDVFQQQRDLDILGVSIGDRLRGRLEEEIEVRREYADRRRELEEAQQVESTKLDEDQYRRRIQALEDAEERKIEILRSSATRKAEAEANWMNGAHRGLQNYLEEVDNVSESASQAVGRAFKGMEDSLVQFVKTGKLDFRSLADSIISDLIRIQVQQSVTKPLAGLLGTLVGGMFAGGPQTGVGTGVTFSSGPLVGTGAWDGGGYTGDGGRLEVAGLVHRGEYVINADSTRRLGRTYLDQLNGYASGGYVGGPPPNQGGGRSIGVTILNQTTGRADRSEARWQSDSELLIAIQEDTERRIQASWKRVHDRNSTENRAMSTAFRLERSTV